MLLYLWLILTAPTDRLICELWTREITSTALHQACGIETAEPYRVDVTQNGQTLCSVPGAALAAVLPACGLSGPLDAYRIRIIEPNVSTALCTVETTAQIEPDWKTITGQCPEAEKRTRNGISIQFYKTRQPKPEADPICKPPAITQPTTIATSKDYYWLAGKLIWNGLAHAQCDGGLSGLDPMTKAAIPCGMDGARPQVLAWQNGMDAEILSAAREWNVPADLLKKLIADETQFWGWTGSEDEHGLTQITDAGAAVVMHVYQPGYYQMSDRQKQSARSAWLRSLDCLNCTPTEAYNHARASMDKNAQALAAYYCMYGSWDAALKAWNIKHKEN